MLYKLATPPTAGSVGDYNPSTNRYFFRQGINRVCVDIQIFRDNMFERDETFSGEIIGVQLPGGSLALGQTGVTVDPVMTVVTIRDMDGM